MKKNYKAETRIVAEMTRWQEVVECELSELEEMGEKRQTCLKNDRIAGISWENRHQEIQCGT